VLLAKRYGIATPYTSYLVVPDAVMPVAPARPGDPTAPRPMGPMFGPVTGGGFGGTLPPGIAPGGAGGRPTTAEDFAKKNAGDAKGLSGNRGEQAERDVRAALDKLKDEKDPAARAKLTEEVRRFAQQKQTWDDANSRFKGGKDGYQTGQLGVDLAIASTYLRNQDRVCLTANRQVNGRNVLEIGGVWIDDAYKADTKSLTVKAQSDAYFRILEKHPEMKDVFRLGNFVVWLSPSGTALVIDQNEGKDKLDDAEIAALFAKK
jgi:Ca-activated chloride channel family protein